MDQAPIGRTVVLNPGFVESLTPQQLDAYVQVLADASENHPDHDTASFHRVIKDGLHAAGIDISPVELNRTAEQLVGHGAAPLTITTHDGKVLFERVARSSLQTSAPEHVDPADPDRPVIS